MYKLRETAFYCVLKGANSSLFHLTYPALLADFLVTRTTHLDSMTPMALEARATYSPASEEMTSLTSMVCMFWKAVIL